MPTDTEEIASYQDITDLKRLQDKRSRHKSQLTKLMNFFTPLFDTSFKRLRRDEVERKHRDIQRQLMFLDALQERIEFVLGTTAPDRLEEERRAAEIVREDYQDLESKVQVLLDKLKVYEEGTDLVDVLSNLHNAKNLTSPNHREDISEVKLRNTKFRKQSRAFSADSEIEELRGQVSRLLVELDRLVTEEHIKSTTEAVKEDKTHNYCSHNYCHSIDVTSPLPICLSSVFGLAAVNVNIDL